MGLRKYLEVITVPAVLAIVLLQAAVSAQGTAPRPLVTQAEFNQWQRELSNWGRWGKDDQAGALNLITAAKRREAAALVKDGITVSLAVDVNEARSADNPTPYERVVTTAGPPYAMDRLAVTYHGGAHTHMDALSHRLFDGRIYNGFEATEVTLEDGAKKDSIYTAHAGIVTRGVLMDIPALKGAPFWSRDANLRGGSRGVGTKSGCEGVSRRRAVHPHRTVGAARQDRRDRQQRHLRPGRVGYSMAEAARCGGDRQRVCSGRTAVERWTRPRRSRLRAGVPRDPCDR